MCYELLGDAAFKSWTCHKSAWRDYLELAIAFGWEAESACFKRDEVGFGEHPFWHEVSDDEACAMAAALDLAVATINAGSPMTDNQATALRAFEIDAGEPVWKDLKLSERQLAAFLKIEAECLAARGVLTIRTRDRTFNVNVRGMMDLADVANAGRFTIT